MATSSSAPLTITVTNQSRTDSITFTRIVAAETFSTKRQILGSPLAPGRSCKVEVVFHPLVTGKVNDHNALTFTDSAQNSPPADRARRTGTGRQLPLDIETERRSDGVGNSQLAIMPIVRLLASIRR
jgi:hypothetical protein